MLFRCSIAEVVIERDNGKHRTSGEAFNVLNHAQWALPNGQLGSPQFGVVTAMLASPSCAFCGTIERQIQIAAKLKF